MVITRFLLLLSFQAQILPFSLFMDFIPEKSWHIYFHSQTFSAPKSNPQYTFPPLPNAFLFSPFKSASLQFRRTQQSRSLPATPHPVFSQNELSPQLSLLHRFFSFSSDSFPCHFSLCGLTSPSFSPLSTFLYTSQIQQRTTRSFTSCHLSRHIRPVLRFISKLLKQFFSGTLIPFAYKAILKPQEQMHFTRNAKIPQFKFLYYPTQFTHILLPILPRSWSVFSPLYPHSTLSSPRYYLYFLSPS